MNWSLTLKDRQGARSRRAADAARPRRRSDRISMDFAAVHESIPPSRINWTIFQTWRSRPHDGSKGCGRFSNRRHGCADLKLALGPRSALVAATGGGNSVSKMKRTRAIEMSFESRMIALLARDAPTITRVAILFNPDTAPHSVYLPLIRAAAQLFSVELISAAVRNATEMEPAIAQLGAQPGGGLLVMPDASIVT
jgi:hypothetical protein